jgi:peptide/nickel transport system permease protein
MTSDRRPPGDNPTAGGPIERGEAVHGTVLADKAMAYPPGAPGGDDIALPGRRAYLQQVIHDAIRPLTARFGLAWICILAFFACFAPFIASSHPILTKSGGQWSSPMLRHLGAADVVLPVVFIAGLTLLRLRRLSLWHSVALLMWIASVVTIAAAWPSAGQYVAGVRDLALGWAGVPGRALRYFSGSGLRYTVGGGISVLLWVLMGLLIVALVVLAALPIWIAALFPIFVLPRKAAAAAAAALAPLLVILMVYPVRPPLNVVYERYREMEKAGRLERVVRTLIPYSPSDRLRDMPDRERTTGLDGRVKELPIDSRLQEPNRRHWTGTDNYGADLLSRQIHACRIALSIGFIATGISVLIGVVVGGLMGYFAGKTDLIGMRLIEILEAIPSLVLLIAITASYGRNIYLMMAVIGLLRWTGDARFIRAEFLKLRNLDFVQAAVASGLPKRSIIFRHMLPNGISPVLVSASFGVASAILLESVLSFLGLGLVDEPSWGEMLNQARAGGAGFNWWIATFPGLLIFLTVFSYNLVGEASRDALDPKLLKRD